MVDRGQWLTSQSRGFSIGEEPGSAAFSTGGGRLFSSRSNRSIVLILLRCNHRLRFMIDDLAVIGTDCNWFVDYELVVLTQVDGDDESVRRRCCLRSVVGDHAQLLACFDSVSGRCAVIVQDVAEHVGGRGKHLLCPFSCGTAVAHPTYFFSFDRFDQRVVLAEMRPGIVVEVIFFLYLLFSTQVFGVACQVSDEIVVL